jgi:hypothetical protein
MALQSCKSSPSSALIGKRLKSEVSLAACFTVVLRFVYSPNCEAAANLSLRNVGSFQSNICILENGA